MREVCEKDDQDYFNYPHQNRSKAKRKSEEVGSSTVKDPSQVCSYVGLNFLSLIFLHISKVDMQSKYITIEMEQIFPLHSS